MYQYVKSFVKPVGVNQLYQDIDVSLMRLSQIDKQFIDGFIELTHTAIDGPVYLSLQDLKSCDLPKRDNLTFEYWLSYIGNKSLPTTDKPMSYTYKTISHRDAIQAGYHPMVCSLDAHYDANLPQSEKKDLYLTKSTGAIGLLRNRALISVNGHLHTHTPYYKGVCVLGGGEIPTKNGDVICSITSFADIGDVSFIPLTADMIHRYAPATPYNQKAIIDTAVDLSDKTVMISLGGVLVYASKVLEIVNPEAGVVKLNLNNFDLIEAIYGAIGNINLESLGILNENSMSTNYHIAKQMLTSDAVVLKYLQLKQTFLIVIDNPNVEIRKEPISPTGIDGKFETHFNPSLPLIDDIGRVTEYWVTSQNNGWYVLHTKARTYKKRITQTIHNKDITSLNASMPVNGFYSFTPHFLAIRAQTLVSS